MTEETLPHQIVIGVDTHDLVHVAVAVDHPGRRLGNLSIPTSPPGYEGFVTWALGLGDVSAVAMEGTESYGRGLCTLLQSRGVRVAEVARPSRKNRRNRRKADLSDAEAAARAFLAGEVTAKPRGSDASIAMIRALRIPREALVNQRTQAINQLRALMVAAPAHLRESLAGLDAKQLIQRVAQLWSRAITRTCFELSPGAVPGWPTCRVDWPSATPRCQCFLPALAGSPRSAPIASSELRWLIPSNLHKPRCRLTPYNAATNF